MSKRIRRPIESYGLFGGGELSSFSMQKKRRKSLGKSVFLRYRRRCRYFVAGRQIRRYGDFRLRLISYIVYYSS